MKTAEQALSVLGLQLGASQEDIRQAYRDLAQVWHPDRFAHNPRLRVKAQARLQEINEAYQILSFATLPHLKRERQPASYTQTPPARSDASASSSVNPASTARSWAWVIFTLFSLALARSCVTAQNHPTSSVASVPQTESPAISSLPTPPSYPRPELTTPSNTPATVGLIPIVPSPAVQDAVEPPVTSIPSSPSLSSGVSDYAAAQKRIDRERAAYWKAQGYTFDPAYMTAYSMDQKVKDMERAAYWKGQGYVFDPSYMTAYSMDQKVKDMERAAYWKEKGYDFDPNYMTAYSMDNEVEKRLKHDNP